MFLAIGVPGPWPGSDKPDPVGFRDLVLSLRAVERLSERGYHLTRDDLRRFHAASAGIERLARLHGHVLASFDANLIRSIAPVDRGRAGYHPPESAPHWLRVLAGILTEPSRSQALQVAEFVAKKGYGLVLSPTVTPADIHWGADTNSAPRTVQWNPPSAPEQAAELMSHTPLWAAFPPESDRVRSADQLWSDCAAALRCGEPIVVGSGARHEVITEVLNLAGAIVSAPVGLGILYADGSRAESFTLHPPRSDRPVSGGGTLKVGLMSMRHTKLDLDVDGYWFRNRAVSTSRTMAETDAYCADATAVRLADLIAAGIGRIELFHTGFEPAVIGFYRGLLRYLNETQGNIQVQPIYLHGQYVSGSLWGAV